MIHNQSNNVMPYEEQGTKRWMWAIRISLQVSVVKELKKCLNTKFNWPEYQGQCWCVDLLGVSRMQYGGSVIFCPSLHEVGKELYAWSCISHNFNFILFNFFTFELIGLLAEELIKGVNRINPIPTSFHGRCIICSPWASCTMYPNWLSLATRHTFVGDCTCLAWCDAIMQSKYWDIFIKPNSNTTKRWGRSSISWLIDSKVGDLNDKNQNYVMSKI